MGVSVREIAREFSMGERELRRESLKAFLLSKSRLLEAERQVRCVKFGVQSLGEMDELIKRGVVEEDAILADFQNVGYLTARIRRIKKLLEPLLANRR